MSPTGTNVTKLFLKNLSHLHIVADHLLAGLVTQDWVVPVLGELDIVPQHLVKGQASE